MLPIIAISGPQSCGKSTLIAHLSARNYKVVARKTSRSIMDDWGVTLDQVNNDRELTVKFQQEILVRKYQDELDARYTNNFNETALLADRSFMDLATYACVAIGKDNEYSDWLNTYYLDCVRHNQDYALIFFLTGGKFPPKSDGIRAINPLYNTMVDLTMREFTRRTVLPHKLIYIDTPSLDERVSIVDNLIRSHLKDTGQV